MFDSVVLGLNSSSSTFSSDDDEKRIDSMHRFVWDDIVGEVMMRVFVVVVYDALWMVVI